MPPLFLQQPHSDALIRESLRQMIAGVTAAPGDDASVVLSGGQSPLALYRLLDALGSEGVSIDGVSPVAWADFRKSHFFWGDERWVPPTNPQSNFGEAWRAWLGHSGIPPEQIHPIPTDSASPAAAVARVEAAWDHYFESRPEKEGRPDVVVLGMGTDGHTASLFPGQPLAGKEGARAMVTTHPESGAPRVTLTLPFLNTARLILFLVGGTGKGALLRRVRDMGARLRGGERLADPGHAPLANAQGVVEKPDPEDAAAWARDDASAEILPAAMVHPSDGTLLWLYTAEDP